MGTPQFAVESLNAIFQSKHEIVGVVTSTDKPAGRGRKIQQSEVKKYCMQLYRILRVFFNVVLG